MPRQLSRTLAPPRTLKELCRAVRETFLGGQQRALEIDVLSRWHTGRLLRESILDGEPRAPHGHEVIPQVAEAEGIELRLLYKCMQFYDAFPKVAGRPLLSWSQYRCLMQIGDRAERQRLTHRAIEQGWNGDDTAARVAAHNAARRARAARSAAAIDVSVAEARDAPPPRLLAPRRGTPGLFPITARPRGLALDRGFRQFRALSAEEARRLARGDIVRFTADGGLRRVPEATKADLFTYPAKLLRVVDGDTLLVELDAGPGEVREEKLRLRGVDCPELATAEGRAAKRFVEVQLDGIDALTICTSKSDKYARYLADVFWTSASGEDVFLNNRLLAERHAERAEGYSSDEWEKGEGMGGRAESLNR